MPNLVIPNSFTPLSDIQSSPMNENFTAIANAVINSLARDGTDAMTAPLQLANGSASAPALAFASDLDLGIYRKTTNQLGFATAGVERLYVDDSGKLWILGATDIAGAVNLQAALTGVATTLVAAGSVLTLRGSADDTSFDILAVLKRGDGSGNDATIEARGDGSNGVDALGFGIGGTQLFSFDVTNFAFDRLRPRVGRPGGGDSVIQFHDDNTNSWRALRWDDDENEWRVEDNGGTDRTVIHSGNLNLVPGALIAIIEDQKSSGTDGGSFNSGADRTRDLNALVYNRDTIVGLAGNQFTLPAGDWEIEWSAPAWRADLHQSLLHDITAGSDVKRGSSEEAKEPDNSNITTRSMGHARVSLSGTTTYEIRHRCETSKDPGFGAATGFGTEVYTQVVIRRG